LVADEVGHDRLHRSVAAAMEHEPRIAAEEARGIDAEREVAADPLPGIAMDHRLGRIVRPQALHASRLPSRHPRPVCTTAAGHGSKGSAGDGTLDTKVTIILFY